MSKRKIQGITIALEGDATSLEKTLKEVDRASSKTGSELSKINSALKFDESNTVLLAQKQEVLQERLQVTTKRLTALKLAQSEVEKMFKAKEIDASSYRDFNRELEITSGKVERFKEQAKDFEAHIKLQAETKTLDDAKQKLDELKNESKLLDAESKKLASSIALQNAQMSSTASETDKLNANYSQITSQIGLANKSINNLEQQLNQTKSVFGDNSAEVVELESKLNKAKTTVAKFENELSSIRDRKIEIQAEADLSAIQQFEDEMETLPNTAKKVGKEVGSNLSKGAALGVAGLTALTVGMMGTNKQLSRLESQSTSALSSVDKLGNNIKKMSDEELDALEKSLDEKEDALSKSFDKQLASAEKSYEAQEKAFEKSLDNEMNALEKNHEKKLKLIDTEYRERLKLIDEEEYRRLQAIDLEIESIEAEQDSIDKANKLAEENAKRLELQDKISNARTKHDKEKATEELADFEAKILETRKAEERKATIDNLKDEKDAIKDSSDAKRDALEDEHTLKVERLEETFEREKESLAQLHDVKREQFNTQKEEYLAKIKEQYDEELKLFQDMNAKKMVIAQTPVETTNPQTIETKVNLEVVDFKNSRIIFDSVNQDVDQSVEALGNLVRAGYETEEDLTKISKNLAGAIQLYGETFNVESLAESITTTTQLGESTGQLTDLLEKSGMTVEDFNAQLQQYETVGERANFISDLLAKQGMTEVYDNFAKTHPEIIKNSEAQVEYIDAISDLTTALTPLITELTKVITKFAEFGAEHPFIAKAFMVLGGVVGAIVSVFGVLYPVIQNIIKVLPKLARFLPWIARGFAVLSGPIGWVILIVTTLIQLVPVVIKHWGKISGFFKKLWEGVKFSFSTAFEGIKIIALAVVNVVKKPINAMIGLINDFLRGVNAIKIPDWVPAVGGRHFKIPEIPMLARGTDYFKGGMAIVGEEGPELVKLPRSASVKTAQETANMLGGGGELTINVPLNIDGRVIANAIAKYTNRELYLMKQRDERGR